MKNNYSFLWGLLLFPVLTVTPKLTIGNPVMVDHNRIRTFSDRVQVETNERGPRGEISSCSTYWVDYGKDGMIDRKYKLVLGKFGGGIAPLKVMEEDQEFYKGLLAKLK